MRTFLLALPLLAGCHDEETRERIANGDLAEIAGTAPAPAPKAVPASGKVEEVNDLYRLTVSWPKEASALPGLLVFIRKDIAEDRDMLAKTSKEEAAFRKSEKLEFTRLEIETKWESAGQSDALLSLGGGHYAYTGGAHPNHGGLALLWDRKADTEVKVASLFDGSGGVDRFLAASWCKELDRQRAERRGGETMEGMFSDCPKLSEAKIVPTDTDGNGRFDRFVLQADPYVAGPYAEGDYEVEVPVTAAMLAGLKAPWRPSFEAP